MLKDYIKYLKIFDQKIKTKLKYILVNYFEFKDKKYLGVRVYVSKENELIIIRLSISTTSMPEEMEVAWIMRADKNI